jgi:Tol biopolymer transport system component
MVAVVLVTVSGTLAPHPAGAAPADSLEAPGVTTRASLAVDGSQLTVASTRARISADGRYVVFRAAHPVQVASGTTQDLGAIMLRDRQAGTTTIVAQGGVTSGLAVAVTAVSQPDISADGRWVAYVIGSPDPAGGRTIRVWDRTTGQSSSPGPLTGTCDQPALSGDGRYLAFRSTAALVKADTNQLADVYVLDRQSGAFDLVSAGPSGSPGYRGQVSSPAISSDGHLVAFASSMIGLVDRQVPPSVMQVYLRDRTAGTTRLVSAGPDGPASDGASQEPSISADGSTVAFASSASAFAGSGGPQVVMTWRAADGSLSDAAVSTEGARADAPSAQPSLSGDGRYVAFASAATNLVPGDTNGIADIFVHDLVSGRTTRVSVGPGPVQATGATTFARQAGGSLAPAMSGDGRYVAFESDATNLVTDDTNGVRDIFVRDRVPGIALSPAPLDFGTTAVGASVPPGTITVSSTGAGPLEIAGLAIAGASAAAFSVTSDACTGATLYPGQTCQVGVAFTPVSAGPATAVLQVADSAPGEPHTDRLTALVVRGGATLKVSPQVGPPGIVVMATGTGFTPNQPVTLTWKPGITPIPLTPVVAGPNGSFRVQVLVLPNDELGPRNLFASSAGSGPGNPSAAAPFLVEAGTAEPPLGPVFREGGSGQGSLVFRH